MPVALNREVHGYDAMNAALETLQIFLGRPVSGTIDNQQIGPEIIKLQTYLQTQGKFSAGSINKTIDDQLLPSKIEELQVAANLP